jgi:hypothetical protein
VIQINGKNEKAVTRPLMTYAIIKALLLYNSVTESKTCDACILLCEEPICGTPEQGDQMSLRKSRPKYSPT